MKPTCLYNKNAQHLPAMPDAEYREVNAVSQSALKHLAKSPAHFRAYLDSPSEETEAMRLGTATHLAVFQPTVFNNEVVMAPKFDRRTTEGKSGALKFEAENAGKICLPQLDYDRCISMAEQVRLHPVVMDIINKGEPEVSVFGTTVDGDVAVKGRLDWVNYEAGIIADLKTTNDIADSFNIRKVISKFKYDLQACHYLELMKSATPQINFRFLFIFVEKETPHGVRIVEINPSDIAFKTMPVLQECLKTLSLCQKSGIYPSYPATVNTIDLF